MNFEEYLSTKKIDSDAFRTAEPSTWEAWKAALEQMHPNSFTIQKLNLINPVRRKYPLKQSGLESQKSGVRSQESEAKRLEQEARSKEQGVNSESVTAAQKQDGVSSTTEGQASSEATSTPPTPKPGVARPVFKPKPKIN